MSIDMPNAVSSKRAEPSYTFQRIHAALLTGHALTVQQKREEPVPVFMQQQCVDELRRDFLQRRPQAVLLVARQRQAAVKVGASKVHQQANRVVVGSRPGADRRDSRTSNGVQGSSPWRSAISSTLPLNSVIR